MKYFIVLLVCTMVLFSCDDNDDPRIQETINWLVGAQMGGSSSMTETRTFDSENADLLTFRLDSSSLCPFYGVRFIIEQNNVEIYSEFFIDFPVEENVDIEQNASMTVTSTIEDNPSNNSVCIWLGNVSCEVKY